MFVDTASGYPHILSGKLRAIGVASPKRVANFDTVPTLAEQGLKGFEAYAWQGLVVPAATPPEVVAGIEQGAARRARDHGREGAIPDPRARGHPEHAGADGRLLEERAGQVGPGHPRRQHSRSTEPWQARAKPRSAMTLDRTVTHRLHTLHKLTDRVSQAAYLADAGMPISRRALPGRGRRLRAAVGERTCAGAPTSNKGQASRAAQALVDQGLVRKEAQRYRRARCRSDTDGQGRAGLAACDGSDRAPQRRDRRLPRCRRTQAVGPRCSTALSHTREQRQMERSSSMSEGLIRVVLRG